MSNADVARFVKHWHDAIDSANLDTSEQQSLDEARRSLPLKLEDAANRRIRELCNTPLLCAMVCVLHWREEGYLPKIRVDLYDKCCEMLIEARDMKRGLEPPAGPLSALSKNDKEMVRQRLAFDMVDECDLLTLPQFELVPNPGSPIPPCSFPHARRIMQLWNYGDRCENP